MWHRRLIIALALSLVVASAVLAQQERWNELNQEAWKLYQEGNYTVATKIAEKSLEVAEKTFGPDHPNVATSLTNLAVLYDSQGKYAEAEPLYLRSLAIWVTRLGPDHPNVATCLNNLAALYRKIGKKEEASKLEERAQKIKSQSGSR
jgi:tetratricopeptide (TPR) repeat protein